MNIKILTKYSGIGNQVWFIPAINKLKECNFVFTDSVLLNELIGLPFNHTVHCAKIKEEKPDKIYTPLWLSWQNLVAIKLQYPFVPIYGFRYRLLDKQIGLGYKNSVNVDMSVPELETINRLIPNKEPFKLENYICLRIKNKVVLGTSNKTKCFYRHWNTLKNYLEKMGYSVVMIGEFGKMYEDIGELIWEIKTAEYFIGVDSGIMHIADILNIPGIVFWGDTPLIKNQPVNKLKVIMGLDTKPNSQEIIKWLNL